MFNNKKHIAHRRHEVARLTFEGLEQAEIAQRLGVTQQQVSHDMKRNTELWQEQALRDTGALLAQTLAELRWVKTEARQAWFDSKQEREVTETEATEGAAQGPRRKAKVRKEARAGDPAFLGVIVTALMDEAKLLALVPPTKVKLDLEDATQDQLMRIARGEPPERVLNMPPPHGMAQA
jgi:predicted transcriptional regulator